MEHASNVAPLSIVAAGVVVWGLVSARLERLEVTAPIAFVVLGVAVTHEPIALIHLQLDSSTIRSVAEVTLALMLFADASRVNARSLTKDAGVPSRLLGIGLPLTIGAGAGLAAALFSSSGIWVAATIAAVVAPTDAALGASMMSDKRVPGRIRQALNVESGLNDGIATPFVNVFLAGALSAESISAGGAGKAAIDLVGGAGVGAAIGLVGAALVVLSARAAWSTAGFRPLTVLALGACAYAAALVVHANGFVAAFCAGVAFGSVVHSHDDLLSFTEEVGTLLSVLVWFSFGAVMLVPGLEAAGWRDLVFGILALTLARVVPVAVALAGSGLSRATVLFIGWFGPRGLASVVFGLIAVDALTPTGAHVVLGAVVVTVAMSVVAHGVSASPLAARFSLGDDVAGHAILGHVGSREVRVRTLASSRRRTTGS